jgi:hypothetical protein
MDVMIGVTNLWLPKYAVRVIIFAKTIPIPPFEMGRKETC